MNSGIPIGQRPTDHLEIMGNVEQPWFHIDAVIFLFQNLKEYHTGFEFGSGSSTFWFSKFTKEITSVESDPIWYNNIQKNIQINGITNINSILSPCEMLSIWESDTENSDKYVEYSDIILAQENNFDYISVDGVARSICIKKSIKKLNSGVLDNRQLGKACISGCYKLNSKKLGKIYF
jgi:hypothetical protein